jgi:hypothetical protein
MQSRRKKEGADDRCLVTRSGIIYYEYSSIISSVPELTSEDKYKEAKFEDWLMRMALANRPDDWVCFLFSCLEFSLVILLLNIPLSSIFSHLTYARTLVDPRPCSLVHPLINFHSLLIIIKNGSTTNIYTATHSLPSKSFPNHSTRPSANVPLPTR